MDPHLGAMKSSVCVCLPVCVCVCVYGGDEGSVSGLGSFPLVPGFGALKAVIHTNSAGPDPRTLLIPTSLRCTEMVSFTPKVRGRWLWFRGRDHREDHGGSCNATCHHVQLSFSYTLALLPLALFLPLSLQFPHLLSFLHFSASPSLSHNFKATWPLLYPSKWDCYEYIWHVWRNFKTHWHPRPLQTDIWRQIRSACVCSKICKSCCVEGEVCYYRWQIQGWGASVGWLQVSRNCKQLNKREGKVVLLFVSVGGGPSH